MAGVCAVCSTTLHPGARFCYGCGAPVGEQIEERKLVTVLFADLVGYAGLAERLDPERLRSVLDAYFAAMAGVIESHGGTLEKFIGDAVVAVFGVPIIREDDAQRALRAALAMLERLGQLNHGFVSQHSLQLQMRIGVNTGEVLASTTAPSQQRLVTGDAVNSAARLQQVAHPGTVLVGERTQADARAEFEFGPARVFEVKGREESIRGYELLRPALDDTLKGIGMSAPMIGRDADMTALLDALADAVESGGPRLVTVHGAAGIGKSRLLAEFGKSVAARWPDARLLKGRCHASGGAAYGALSELLRAAFDIKLDEPAETVNRRIREGTESLLEPLGVSQGERLEAAAALTIIAGVSANGAESDIDRASSAERMLHPWPLFATAFARGGPAVFVIEDLHWASEQLLQAIERIVLRATGPLLIVATARPEFAESGRGFKREDRQFVDVTLHPLSEEQGEEMVRGLLDTDPLPGALESMAVARADGNPFFIEQLIRHLVEDGTLVRTSERWIASPRPDARSVPDSIHALLAARIDALAASEKRVLQQAALVGRIFWDEPLVQTLGRPVDGELLGLERKGLIFPRPGSEFGGSREFAFKHALVRDVAYATVPKVRRAREHAQIAAWFESIARDATDELAEVVADHYAEAVSSDPDLAWEGDADGWETVRQHAYAALMRAGDGVRKRWVLSRATDYHVRALHLAVDEDERQRALVALENDQIWFPFRAPRRRRVNRQG